MRKLAIILTLVFDGCGLFEPWTGTVPFDAPFELPYNGIATVEGEGLEIAFLRVVSDSRPAYDENSVSPGRVVVQLKLETGAEGGTIVSLSTNWYDDNYPGTIDTLGFRLSLLGIEPHAATKGKRIPSKDYVAQIEVMEPWREGTLNLLDGDSYGNYMNRSTGLSEWRPISVAGDTLIVPVRYGGGCNKHDFYLIGACPPPSTYAALVVINVIHDANGDACKAYLAKTLKFDLSPLRRCGLAGKAVAIQYIGHTATVLFGL